jgi:hypothetical protein
MKNYLIEDRETGRTVASGLAKSARDARKVTGCTGRRYVVTEATAKGISYQPIKQSIR